MGVAAAADDSDPALRECGGERARVLDHALPVDPELRAKGLAQAHRLGGEDVGVEAPLYSEGTPWTEGALANSSERARMSPPRGPRRVLVVVQVTMSA